jgi:Ca2+-binding RTX toxin-like protein
VISVGHGANLVEGRGGNDRITGSNPSNDDIAYEHYFVDERDADEVLRGGAGNDTIVGGTNVFGDAGADTLIAGWASNDFQIGNRMTGGAGADRFVFSDEHHVGVSNDDIEILAQEGTLLDFDAGTGDRVVIDRLDDTQPLPEYAGVVDDYLEIEQGSYGFVEAFGIRVLYYAVLVGTDFGGYTGGVTIGGVENVSAGDVLFV